MSIRYSNMQVHLILLPVLEHLSAYWENANMLQGHCDLARKPSCTSKHVHKLLSKTSINIWFNAYLEGTVYQICMHIRQLGIYCQGHVLYCLRKELLLRCIFMPNTTTTEMTHVPSCKTYELLCSSSHFCILPISSATRSATVVVFLRCKEVIFIISLHVLPCVR